MLFNLGFLAAFEIIVEGASRFRSFTEAVLVVDADAITLLLLSSRLLDDDAAFEPNANISLPWCGAPIFDLPGREIFGLFRSIP